MVKMRKLSMFFIVVVALSLSGTLVVFGQGGLRYKLLADTSFEGESNLSVKAFDLRRDGTWRGIAVCGKRLYIVGSRGRVLLSSASDHFPEGVNRVRIGKFEENGHYDKIVACGPGNRRVIVFDITGVPLSVISGDFFSLMDLTGDGIDEIVLNRQALKTQDGGKTWAVLWRNGDIGNIQDIAVFEGAGGFCYNVYVEGISAVNNNGDILFRTKPGKYIRCIATVDFYGDGNKDQIAVPDVSGTVYMYELSGIPVSTIPVVVDGEIVDLNEVTSIASGRLSKNHSRDSIVIGGRRGIVAFNMDGGVLWSYIRWPGRNAAARIDNLLIEDLNGDGEMEVVAGKGGELFVFSNTGALISRFSLEGGLSSWKHPNAKIDIADVTGDGYKEIIAVTSAGRLYIFEAENKEIR
jgi:outer membrane protein assembly factor BamB